MSSSDEDFQTWCDEHRDDDHYWALIRLAETVPDRWGPRLKELYEAQKAVLDELDARSHDCARLIHNDTPCVVADGMEAAVLVEGGQGCRGCGWFVVRPSSVTAQPALLSPDRPVRRQHTFEKLISDLGRCQHGRHGGDACSGGDGCDGRSAGNFLYPEPGTVLGWSLGARYRIVVPPVEQRDNPDAWYVS